ncbi:CpsD/CapB family tyrosine-protein kinase [Chloroflexia bacterium SDU3-3]|nr:CpsD/CapB family tyrosine-protein kinase [Chloroflexia bacterium SDU3-3]
MPKLGKRSKPIPAASLPTVLLSAAGVPLTVFSAEVIASYRRMITGMLYREHIPARIAMVSAIRGEGVTYSALALATTMASDLAQSVCVVELNWASPGLQRQLGEATRPPKKRFGKPAPPPDVDLPTSLGVSGVLAGQATLDEALIATSLTNLLLLPAGEMPPHQWAMASRSQGLDQLLAELAGRFDHIIIDAPALMANSDGIAIASRADAACVVVRQGITPVSFVRRALDEVKHIQMLGVVLNQTKVSMPRWIYNRIPQD